MKNGDSEKKKSISIPQPQTNGSKISSSKDRPLIPFPSLNSRKEKEPEKTKTFIKIDYIKPTPPNDPQKEKGREEVSRVLDFSNGVNAPQVKTEIKTEKVEDVKPPKIVEEAEKAKKKLIENDLFVTPIKTEEKVEKESSSASKSSSKQSSSKSSSHSDHKHNSHHHHGSGSSSSHHKSHSSSSSHHKSSSKSSRSSRECSKCYKRSKIKKANTGVQTRLDYEIPPKQPTRQLEFEPSHRVGVNREPVTIDTNLSYLKYGRFYHIEVHPNGGASIVHMYQDELDTLKPEELNELVDEFFELVFSEDENNFAYHVMGIVHDGARYIPDLLEHMAENYSNLTVKAGVIGKANDIETCSMLEYYGHVMKNYNDGTVRYGPLHQISLVGKVHEEVGGYFPDLLGKLEQNAFLKKSMPWGKLSIVQMDPRLSNDGPILWIRPGEQLIPTAEMKTPMKRQRTRINELRNLQYLPRSSEAREIMFEDRTKAHAGLLNDLFF